MNLRSVEVPEWLIGDADVARRLFSVAAAVPESSNLSLPLADSSLWKGGRAVYAGCLENSHVPKGVAGSNPAPSAMTSRFRWAGSPAQEEMTMKTPDKVIIEVTGDAICVRVYAEGDVVSARECRPRDVSPMSSGIEQDIGRYYFLGSRIISAGRRVRDISLALRDLR